MKYYGTKNKTDYGFYEEPFEGAIEVTDEYWNSLLSAQNEGKIIILFENNVIAVNENEYSHEKGEWHKLSEMESKIKQLNIQHEIRKKEILEELDVLDLKRIRALAEPSYMELDVTWLEYYNKKIAELRKELSEIADPIIC